MAKFLGFSYTTRLCRKEGAKSALLTRPPFFFSWTALFFFLHLEGAFFPKPSFRPLFFLFFNRCFFSPLFSGGRSSARIDYLPVHHVLRQFYWSADVSEIFLCALFFEKKKRAVIGGFFPRPLFALFFFYFDRALFFLFSFWGLF